jgi:FtsH-binding integral membrane protein
MARTIHDYAVNAFHGLKILSIMNGKREDVLPVHGRMMLIVWAVIAPLSIFFGKFGRNFMPRKLAAALHVLCNLGMVACGGFAILLAVNSCTSHFVSLHQKIGITIAALSIVQGVLGLALAITRGRFSWIRKLHGILGIALWFAAMNNAFLGSEMLGWNIGIYMAGYMFLMITIFVGLKFCASNRLRGETFEDTTERKAKGKKEKVIKIQGLATDHIAKKRRSARRQK